MTITNTTKIKTDNFETKMILGNAGERSIGKFLEFMNFQIQDVSKDKSKRHLGYDFVVMNSGIKVEIKSSLAVTNKMLTICIEEDANCDERYGKLRPGWLYTSTAETICFAKRSKEKNKMAVIFKFDDNFKNYYKNISKKYPLQKNYPTMLKGNPLCIGSYRKIPLKEFPPSMYATIGYYEE